MPLSSPPWSMLKVSIYGLTDEGLSVGDGGICLFVARLALSSSSTRSVKEFILYLEGRTDDRVVVRFQS
jgi:hypothetical protein